MSISLNNPELRPSVTIARLRRLTVDSVGRMLVAVVEFGYINNGSFVLIRTEKLLYTPDTTPTFGQAINAIPGLAITQNQIEDLLAAGPIPGTRI